MPKLKPHVFHLGIPKSGSTSIQDVLQSDSRIILSRSRYYTSSEWWEEELTEINSEKIIVESNETLISGGYQKVKFYEVVERIYKTNPSANIILVLRNQPDAVLSMYKFHIVNAFWKSNDFRKWMFETDLGMDYLSICMYGSIAKVLSAFFPKEQIHFLFFEELTQDPVRFYEKFYKILGISSHLKNFPVSNKNNFNRDQLYTLTLLNKFALFKRKSESRFYFSRGHRLEQAMKFSFVRNFKFKGPKDFFSWERIQQKERIFQEFQNTNQELIDLGIVSREDLARFGYPLPE